MRQIQTIATFEPCYIEEVYPSKFTVLVRGERLQGVGQMEIGWTDYSCPGEFPKEDAAWNGRLPEKGTRVLVAVEWIDAYPLREIAHAYIIGYLPYADPQFNEKGYNCGRENSSGPAAAGDYVATTSARSFYKLSVTGNIIEECTPGNYRKRSPMENTVYDVCENRHTHVSGFTERITYDEFGDRGNNYTRVLWRKLPQSSEFNTADQRTAALSDKNVVILEEFGSNVANDFTVPGAENSISKPIYKFSIIKDGVAVYSKVVDEAGNIVEGNTGNRDMFVGSNLSIWVANKFRSVAVLMESVFGAASSAVSGFGSGVWDLVASRVNFRKG